MNTPKSNYVVLGLGGSGHEWSSCIISNNEIIAISEERLCRKKYGIGTDLLSAISRKVCLRALDIDINAVHYFAACSLVPKPFFYSFRNKIDIINHHLAHAYSAFASSKFKKTAIIVADNSGSILTGSKIGKKRNVETISLYKADQNGIELIERVVGEHKLEVNTESAFYQPGETTNSLGHFYRSVSLLLNFSFQESLGTYPISEDGKTMGLSSYGDNRFVDKIGELIKIFPDSRLVEIPIEKLDEVFRNCLGNGSFENRASLAYAVQYNFERILLHCAEYAYKRTGFDNLCLAGGAMLNSVANGMLKQKSPFRQIFVVSAPSDDGISLGCAYYALHNLCNIPILELPPLQTAYLGPTHTISEIDYTIKKYKLNAESPSNLIEIIATALAEGRIVGWFDGKSEFGPRSLGHRSILAAPFPKGMRDKLNNEIKHREWFRPYGPIVPLEETKEYFDFVGESPFMSFVCKVTKPNMIPAATHIDGTARLQTLTREVNPKLYELLKTFKAFTSIPVLINTSFNNAGEPIVETVEDAIKSAIRMKLDMLVLHDRIIYLSDKYS